MGGNKGGGQEELVVGTQEEGVPKRQWCPYQYGLGTQQLQKYLLELPYNLTWKGLTDRKKQEKRPTVVHGKSTQIFLQGGDKQGNVRL